MADTAINALRDESMLLAYLQGDRPICTKVGVRPKPLQGDPSPQLNEAVVPAIEGSKVEHFVPVPLPIYERAATGRFVTRRSVIVFHPGNYTEQNWLVYRHAWILYGIASRSVCGRSTENYRNWLYP